MTFKNFIRSTDAISKNGVDYGYRAERSNECKTIAAKSGNERMNNTKTLILKVASFVFRVSNRDVVYEFGFWRHSAAPPGRATLPRVSVGSLTIGTTKDYKVDLAEGEYLRSFPQPDANLHYKASAFSATS